MANASNLRVNIRGLVVLFDVELWISIEGFCKGDEVRINFHALHGAEETLVRDFVKCFFPVEQKHIGRETGAFADFLNSADTVESVGGAPVSAEAELSKVEVLIYSFFNADFEDGSE